MQLPSSLNQKYQQVKKILLGYGRVAVAFSGGVDSSLVVKIGHDTLGDNLLALFADSLLQPREERQGAVATAQAIGVRLDIVHFTPLALPEFVANPTDRCYYCKKAIFSAFLDLASHRDIPCLVDGTNNDDLSQHRPGGRALAELGVKSPLAEAGLTKEEIRRLSRALGLSTWDKPSASCLATRIPANTLISASALALVDQAERYLHDLGYHGCRVRLKTGAATIELAAGDIARLGAEGDFKRVRAHLNSLGVEKVFLDLLERESILS